MSKVKWTASRYFKQYVVHKLYEDCYLWTCIYKEKQIVFIKNNFIVFQFLFFEMLDALLHTVKRIRVARLSLPPQHICWTHESLASKIV